MTIQLRQICLVANQLAPVVEDLTDILGIHPCYVDPGVGVFGLENTLMPIGVNFLEVVAPVQDNTAAGRYLARRQGDGGYMVITQADSYATHADVRQRALDNAVRIAHEHEQGPWKNCQLHPGDMQAAFLEIEADQYNDFGGYWHPVGGTGWEDKVNPSITIDWTGVELQGNDPLELAELWGRVAGLPIERNGSQYVMAFNNAIVRFVEARDGRGPGLSGVDIKVADREHILSRARARGCYVDDGQVTICGTHWYLKD